MFQLLHRTLLGPLFALIRMGHIRAMATPGALAVGVLTEFITRACVPPDQKMFFMSVTKNLLGVMHGVIKAGGGSLSGMWMHMLLNTKQKTTRICTRKHRT